MITLGVAMWIRLGIAIAFPVLMGWVVWRALRRENNGFGCLNVLKPGRSHRFPY